MKGLTIALLNICSLRNKIQDVDEIVQSNNINILALCETHLDSSFEDDVVRINNYTIFKI